MERERKIIDFREAKARIFEKRKIRHFPTEPRAFCSVLRNGKIVIEGGDLKLFFKDPGRFDPFSQRAIAQFLKDHGIKI